MVNMDIVNAIKSRKSIRAYLAQPVSQEIIREILEVAMRAPSALNTQPWEITVVCGEALENIKRDNVANILSGVPGKEQLAYQGIYHQRQVELAIDLFKLMDIKREERDKRNEWLLRGFRFFDAPAAIILSVDKSLQQNTMALHDIGALAQTICLAATNYGLGTCIEGQGIAFHEIIKKHTGMSEDKNLVIGIALGYPDPTFPANQIVSRRASVDDVIVWVGF
jgi:nitroreductase